MTAPPEKEAAAPRKDAAAVQGVNCSLTKGQCDNRHTGSERFRRAKLIFRAYEAELLTGNVQRAKVLLERWRRVLKGDEP